jgi:VIT1/CCC1 family predicted Fe2+/Mn2+ transporter
VVTARNTVILVVLIWALGHAFAPPLSPHDWGRWLLAAGAGISIFLGIAAGLTAQNEVRLLEAELERERREIQEHPEEERDEVRALYAAKGFREPMLSEVVDVLCADDDRLLKVMMEEELGLFVQEGHHPVLVGAANAAIALAASLVLALPTLLLSDRSTDRWLPLGGAVLVAGLAVLMARFTGQPTVPLAARWVGLGGVSVGMVHFLGQWIAA